MHKLSPNSITIKQLSLILAAITLLLSFAFYRFIFLEQQQQLLLQKNIYAFEKKQLDIVEYFKTAHPDIDMYVAELNEKAAYVSRMLPDNEDIGAFILEIEKTAVQSGVKVIQFKPLPLLTRQGYNEIPVEIAIRGDYFRQLAFLDSLENSLRFNIIKTASMQFKQDTLEAKYNLLIYNRSGQTNNNTQITTKQP